MPNRWVRSVPAVAKPMGTEAIRSGRASRRLDMTDGTIGGMDATPDGPRDGLGSIPKPVDLSGILGVTTPEAAGLPKTF